MICNAKRTALLPSVNRQVASASNTGDRRSAQLGPERRRRLTKPGCDRRPADGKRIYKRRRTVLRNGSRWTRRRGGGNQFGPSTGEADQRSCKGRGAGSATTSRPAREGGTPALGTRDRCDEVTCS